MAVTDIQSHPGFGDTWGEDIALMKLATPVERPVTPIHRTAIGFGTAVMQVGFGVADDNGGGGGVLRKLAEQNVDCALTGDPTTSNDKVLCFDPADGGGCYGDSGGPTFVDVGGVLHVVGVTSGGTGDSCTTSFGIWSLVPAELSFLDEVMGVEPEPEPDPDPEPEEPVDPEPVDEGGCSTGSAHGGGLALLGWLLLRRRAKSGARFRA